VERCARGDCRRKPVDGTMYCDVHLPVTQHVRRRSGTVRRQKSGRFSGAKKKGGKKR